MWYGVLRTQQRGTVDSTGSSKFNGRIVGIIIVIHGATIIAVAMMNMDRS